MFPRILLRNETWLMTIGWLGLGRMEVSNWETHQHAVAPTWLKNHFVNTFHELEKQGWSIHPDNRTVMNMVEAYAGFVMNPTGLIARTVLSRPPETVAATIIQSAQQVPRSVRPALPPHPWTYYAWLEAEIACPQCDWIGLGEKCATGEGFDEGCEKHCPKCDHRFGYVLYPTIQEAATDHRATAVDRELARRQLSEEADAFSVLATENRDLVWVTDNEGLSEIRTHGSWGSAGYELLDKINALLPVLGKERASLVAEARQFAKSERRDVLPSYDSGG